MSYRIANIRSQGIGFKNRMNRAISSVGDDHGPYAWECVVDDGYWTPIALK